VLDMGKGIIRSSAGYREQFTPDFSVTIKLI